MNQTIQQFLNALVPIAQIEQIVSQVLPGFVLVGAMIVYIGFIMGTLESEHALSPITRAIVLMACMAASPWFLGIAESIANGLVAVIGGAVPSMNFLVVNNPNNSSLAMDFSKPFATLGQYVTGTIGTTPGLMQLDKWPDYIMRSLVIGAAGIVAAFTVVVMEVMLILQKLILVLSGPLIPLWIACLGLPAAKGSAQNFLKFVCGTVAWPLGWAIVSIGTMAGLQNLQPPSWAADLPQLLLAFIALGVVCLWMIAGTVGAPFLISKMVTSGTNFAASLATGFASTLGQHAERGVRTGSAVGGALAGSLMGPAGAAIGALAGEHAGRALSLPLSSITHSADGVNEGRQPVSSSKSRGVADAAIGLIKRGA
jgi:hypothetical protein